MKTYCNNANLPTLILCGLSSKYAQLKNIFGTFHGNENCIPLVLQKYNGVILSSLLQSNATWELIQYLRNFCATSRWSFFSCELSLWPWNGITNKLYLCMVCWYKMKGNKVPWIEGALHRGTTIYCSKRLKDVKYFRFYLIHRMRFAVSSSDYFSLNFHHKFRCQWILHLQKVKWKIMMAKLFLLRHYTSCHWFHTVWVSELSATCIDIILHIVSCRVIQCSNTKKKQNSNKNFTLS